MRQVEANLREWERNSMKNEDLFAQNVRFEEKLEAAKAKLENVLSAFALLTSPALTSPSVGFGLKLLSVLLIFMICRISPFL